MASTGPLSKYFSELFSLLFFVGIILAIYIYFEPFSEGVTGFYVSCARDEIKFGTSSKKLECNTTEENWNELTEIKFFPNKDLREVVLQFQNGDSSTLKECTIFDRKNWQCASGDKCQTRMRSGDLKEYACHFDHLPVNKWQGNMRKFSQWVN